MSKATNKIKSLLQLYGFNFSDYARKLDIKPQSLNTKAKANAYRFDDLLDLAELTETKLAFVDSNGKVVVEFAREDI